MMQQNTRQALLRMVGQPYSDFFPYAKKHFDPSPENAASIEMITCGATCLTFVPEGLACSMPVHVAGERVKFAKGTIWVPLSVAQRFDVCQAQVQAEDIEGTGVLSSTFYCGNLSLPCPHQLPFVPTPFTLKNCSSQDVVWQQTDGPAAKKVSREQALKQRLSKLPKVIGSGGTENLARVTAVTGRWLEVQPTGDLRAPVASVSNGWAHAFLERGPWRGNAKLATMSKTYDVAITVEQYYVADGGNGDGGFWILADVTGSLKKADLVGIWLTVALLPSMGLPKLPHRVTAPPPKPILEALGAEAIQAMSSAAASSSAGEADGATDKEAGAYWSVEAGAKRSRTSKAAMSSGVTML